MQAVMPTTPVVRATVDRPAAAREIGNIRIDMPNRMVRMAVTEHLGCPTADCWNAELCPRTTRSLPWLGKYRSVKSYTNAREKQAVGVTSPQGLHLLTRRWSILESSANRKLSHFRFSFFDAPFFFLCLFSVFHKEIRARIALQR